MMTGRPRPRLYDYEKVYKAYQKYGTKKRAAKMLDMPRTTLIRIVDIMEKQAEKAIK
jgi:hypothetical protein